MIEIFPDCDCLFVSVNKHRSHRVSLEDYLKRPIFEESPEEWIEECLKEGSICEIQVHPNLPDSFFHVFAPHFSKAVIRMWDVWEGKDC